MTIETKFNINDLVQHKYQRQSIGKTSIAFEIVEIKAVNCYTTAQVFYTCRGIHAITEYDFEKKNKKVVDILAGRVGEHTEYQQFREDELKSCPEEIKNIILNIE